MLCNKLLSRDFTVLVVVILSIITQKQITTKCRMIHKILIFNFFIIKYIILYLHIYYNMFFRKYPDVQLFYNLFIFLYNSNDCENRMQINNLLNISWY